MRGGALIGGFGNSSGRFVIVRSSNRSDGTTNDATDGSCVAGENDRAPDPARCRSVQFRGGGGRRDYVLEGVHAEAHELRAAHEFLMTVRVYPVRAAHVCPFRGGAAHGRGHHVLHHARRIVVHAAAAECADDDRKWQPARLRQRQ